MSSRLFVFLIPLIVIAIFWLMAKAEKRQSHDPTHKSFFDRNGTVLGLTFILLEAVGRAVIARPRPELFREWV